MAIWEDLGKWGHAATTCAHSLAFDSLVEASFGLITAAAGRIGGVFPPSALVPRTCAAAGTFASADGPPSARRTASVVALALGADRAEAEGLGGGAALETDRPTS